MPSIGNAEKAPFFMGMDYMKADVKSPHTILEKYTALLDISSRLNSEKNFDQLLKLIADEATKHVDAERINGALVFHSEPVRKPGEHEKTRS